MSNDYTPSAVSRRAFLRRVVLGGAALATLPILQACSSSTPAPTAAPAKPAGEAKPAAPAAGAAAPAGAPAQGAPAQQAAGSSGADLEAAKKEGKLVWYTPTTEEDLPKVLAAFKAKYPFVDVGEYLRLQTGKLYAKVLPEMEQNVQSCDVLTLSEIALSIDFQNKGYWLPYLSPEVAK